MSTIDVLNAEGAVVPVELPLVPGRSAAATSRPVALSTEDKAALDLIHTDLSGAATAANQTSANTKLDTLHTDLSVVGRAAAISSRPSVLSTEDKAAIDLLHSDLTTAITALQTLAGAIVAGSSGPAAASQIAIAATLRDVNVNGGQTPANSSPVVNADQYGAYETVAASSTAQALGATGGAGDYLAGVLVFPGAAGCGVVTILDNATVIGTFAGGGTTALPSLVPFMIPVGLFSVSGAWKITTGASVTAVGIGKFT